jgi:ankyrin repeat protein
VYAASDGTSIYNIQSLRSQALLAPGVSITAKDADSFSPLHYALKIKQPGLLKSYRKQALIHLSPTRQQLSTALDRLWLMSL